jgi:hypothetical protein
VLIIAVNLTGYYSVSLIVFSENALGPADASGPGDHAGNTDTHRAVTAGTQNAFIPDEFLHFL